MGYHSSSLQEDPIVLVVLSDFDKSWRLTSCWPQKKVLAQDLNHRIVKWGEPLNLRLKLWLLLNKKPTILLMPKIQASITVTCMWRGSLKETVHQKNTQYWEYLCTWTTHAMCLRFVALFTCRGMHYGTLYKGEIRDLEEKKYNIKI